MSELDKSNSIVLQPNSVQDTNNFPVTKSIIADAKSIKISVEGDRVAYRRTMAAYEVAIDSGAKMNPQDIIGAAVHRGDPLQTIEVDARLMNSAVGIKDYPDGSFTGVFKGEKRVVISGELQAPISNINELIKTSTQVIPTQTNLVASTDQQINTVDVVQGIRVSADENTSLPAPADHDAELENSPFLKKVA